MKRLHESGLFYFSKKDDRVRVHFTSVPQPVRSYSVEPRESSRKIGNILPYWDFREGDRLHVFLSHEIKTFTNQNGKMMEVKNMSVATIKREDLSDEDQLLYDLGLLEEKYKSQEENRERENAELKVLLEMSRIKE